jgi:hypothetical protein
MQVWLYEHVPNLVSAKNLSGYPRMFKWGGVDYPKTMQSAENRFVHLQQGDVLPKLHYTKKKKNILRIHESLIQDRGAANNEVSLY